MVRWLVSLLSAAALLIGACSDDDPVDASSTPIATSSTTSVAPPSTSSDPPESPAPPVDASPCLVGEAELQVDSDPDAPEFPEARLEAGLANPTRASAAFESTVWLAQDDAVPGGDPSAGPVRVLGAEPKPCFVRDITVVGDNLYALTCLLGSDDECWHHRLDPRTGEVRQSEPAGTTGGYVDNDDTLLAARGGRLSALDLDLTERWTVREPWDSLGVVAGETVWINQSDGRRLDLATGEDLEPFDPADRVVWGHGDLVAVVDTTMPPNQTGVPGRATVPDVRLLDRDLVEQGRWTPTSGLGFDGGSIATLRSGLSASQWLPVDLERQSLEGSWRIGLVDMRAGVFDEIAVFSGDPVSRGGDHLLEFVEVIDDRLWFWWEQSIWSLPVR